MFSLAFLFFKLLHVFTESVAKPSSQDYCTTDVLMLNDDKMRIMLCVRGGSD